ncbi:DUF4189 domain-containing protein [Lysobacter sp. K5869]|uniref:DUF4189 domain-containing protein n=1 Tax=Lysobacter sp. K5869 TaxID=2820808 RepID=UPI001C05FB2F|nr:DUF4189 domain-containing protein [Lysobacter sp. K5869]QWP75709.1 DUF4189 domain-containing protein [Lysobacter sp. K5869]
MAYKLKTATSAMLALCLFLFGDSIAACDLQRGNGWQGCAEQSGAATVYYDRWGAIATDESNGAFGVAEWVARKDSAERKALKECKKNRGVDCAIKFTYKNECVSVITGSRMNYFQSSISDQAAISHGMSRCKMDDSDCKVFYVGCSLARKGI